jgi:tetratricopeptide (TPR) repeat protein
LPATLVFALVLAATGSMVTWALSVSDDTQGGEAAVDVSLASRLAVSAQGAGVVRDHPLFGTGLGSWLHAFRPYIEPPIAGGIWDRAHNDYLELVADTGVAGTLIVLAFALAVGAAIRGSRANATDERAIKRRSEAPPGFERRDWHAALEDTSSLRWGLAGGVAAILVHSAVDFSLRMPANLLLLMVILGLLVLTRPPAAATRGFALPAFAVLFTLALVPRAANALLGAGGWWPFAPEDCHEMADLVLDEEDDGRAQALALLHRALDWSPSDRELHEEVAEALGPGPEGEEALRRALIIEPWAIEVRDELGLRLLARGQRAAGAAELEESMYRFPYLVSHAYLSPDLESGTHEPKQLVRALVEGDTLPVRLASLGPEETAAIERGLRHALDERIMGDERAAVVADLVSVLEARERWNDAAAVLASEGRRSIEGGENLAHAARNYLKTGDYDAAEKMLLAAMVREPQQGDLYRDLAVEIYAKRGDFPMAESVLEAGERNAIDMLPVYAGVVQVLARRETARAGDLAVLSRAGEDSREEIATPGVPSASESNGDDGGAK